MPWVSVALPPELVEKLAEEAKSKGKTVGEIVSEALALFLGCPSNELSMATCSEPN